MIISQEEIAHLAQDLSPSLDLGLIKPVLESVKSQLPETAYSELSKACADKTIIHPDWGLLGGRIQIHGLRQQIKLSFAGAVKLYPEIYFKDYADFVLQNVEELEEMIVPERDMAFDTFGYSTLFKSYLLRKYEPTGQNQTPTYLETPQYMYLRIATYLWFPDLEKIKQCYDRFKQGRILARLAHRLQCRNLPPTTQFVFSHVYRRQHGRALQKLARLCHYFKKHGGARLRLRKHSPFEHRLFRKVERHHQLA